ncbi:von Willebrand factor A domain-containing protein 7-like [Salarias fasciatus]|uniref:von Willebrand factor A domain-containing protein 7-like n=1 Tax=Salarias fasciatus TaxID=181472 RepID=UPI0011768533|nr:von Willebrand factor A domain-containing protein 7-like [Salarias fasciatus]
MFLLVLLLPGLSHSFNPNYGSSISHRSITETASLRKTLEVCRDLAIATRGDFTLTIDDNLSVNAVLRACSSDPTSNSPLSSDDFQTAIKTIHRHNTKVDSLYAFSAAHHFDNEAFQEGQNVITKGLANVKANVKSGNFGTARDTLGEICHTLQDFYSHSNWVELGKTTPYSTLIRQDQPLENLAGLNVPTCVSCIGDDCTNNILPEVIDQQLLTSGYFDNLSGDKPAGKCSHGGDLTSFEDPEGGINKDTRDSEHGFLHDRAADLALDATLELLEDIRVAVGDKDFLRFMGLSQSSALCFVIDTTGSMSDDIAAVKEASFQIIDSRRGTPEEPSLYILVPFSDPDFGPVLRTTDPDDFKASINRLTADGGGDYPELSLSGLQLALTAAPPASDIFLYTDAPAKDAYLKNTVTALLESTKSVVTFTLTGGFAARRRRRQSDGQNPLARSLTKADTDLYRDLARASGGQTIEISKLDLTQATAVIEDLTANAVVTVFQATVDPGHPDNFPFAVDASIRNIIIYITGVQASLTFRLTSSTGVSQDSSEPSGPLATFSTVGNLCRISLNNTDTGMWEISVNSNSAYIVKVTGQSSVNFVYDIVEEREGAHGGLDFLDGRPPTGLNDYLAQANSNNIEPGSSLSFPFTVSSSVSGTFPLQVRNDRSYDTTAPNSVTIASSSGGVANGTVTLTVPTSAESGTDVTVTIEVENAAGTQMNFAVLRFSVVTRVTDISSPVCQVVSTTGICPASSSLCATTQWEFIAKLTDGINGTGIVTVSLRQGNGILNTSMEVGPGGENITVVTYSSSCCSQSVEVAAVDGVGNVGRCSDDAVFGLWSNKPNKFIM